MNIPRFNRGLTYSPPPRWRRLENLAAPRVSHRKKIFAVVSPRIVTSAGRKPIRRVLIFDNHPATFRLLRDIDLAERRKKIGHILISMVLAVVAVLGIFLLLR